MDDKFAILHTRDGGKHLILGADTAQIEALLKAGKRRGIVHLRSGDVYESWVPWDNVAAVTYGPAPPSDEDHP